MYPILTACGMCRSSIFNLCEKVIVISNGAGCDGVTQAICQYHIVVTVKRILPPPPMGLDTIVRITSSSLLFPVVIDQNLRRNPSVRPAYRRGAKSFGVVAPSVSLAFPYPSYRENLRFPRLLCRGSAPPPVRLVSPACAGILVVMANAHPSRVALIGFLIQFDNACHLAVPSAVFEPAEVVLPGQAALPCCNSLTRPPPIGVEGYRPLLHRPSRISPTRN